MIERVPFRALIAALLASTFLSAPGLAADPSGSVVRVDPSVNASGAAGARVLEVQGAIFVGDEIVASPNGLAQIRFIDNTRIVVGPNSRLVIDEFVFNPDQTARKVSVSAVKGVFRFISGNSPHEAYSIRTPTMTIGVRGTVVDIAVRSADSTAVFIEGSGPVCDNGGACVIATDDCTLHVVPNGGGVQNPSRVETQQRLATSFPFIGSQIALAPPFRANTNACGTTDSRFFGPPPESQGSRNGRETPYQ